MDRTNDKNLLQRREAQLKALLIDSLAGNESAYRQFLSTLSTHIRGFLRHRLQAHSDDTEDITQEVLLAIHNARHTWMADQPVTAWVHAIARYKLADHYRSHYRRDAKTDALDETALLFAEPELEQAQARRDVGLLLEQLPERQRLPVQRVKLEGMSVAETAKLTGMSESAVKIGVYRGLRALAAKMRGKE